MFRKQVKIFGRSVPVVVVALAVTAVVALGAWLIIVATINADVTSATFDNVVLDSASIDPSSTGSCTAGASGGVVTVGWSDARPSQFCLIDLSVLNGNGAPAYLTLDKSGVPAEIILDDSGSDGMTSLPAVFAHYMVRIELDPVLSSPGTAYPFSFTLNATP